VLFYLICYYRPEGAAPRRRDLWHTGQDSWLLARQLADVGAIHRSGFACGRDILDGPDQVKIAALEDQFQDRSLSVGKQLGQHIDGRLGDVIPSWSTEILGHRRRIAELLFRWLRLLLLLLRKWLLRRVIFPLGKRRTGLGHGQTENVARWQGVDGATRFVGHQPHGNRILHGLLALQGNLEDHKWKLICDK